MSENKIAPALGQAYELGQWMGRKQAFSGLAGRCSAADAECLRQIRSRKQYRALKLTWRQFCEQRVGVSQVTADRIIGLLEEFGPAYFLLSQATRISEREYRQISSAVRGQNLLCAGEEIPIDADHAPKLNAAIEQLRRELPALPARAKAEDGPADADGEAGQAGGKAKADPGVAQVRSGMTDAEKLRIEVASEMQRARCDAHAGLDLYKQLLTRRLEPHIRTLLISALHILAGRAQDLWEEALRR